MKKALASISMMVTPAFFAGITLKTPYVVVILALGVALGQTTAAIVTVLSFLVLFSNDQLDPLTILTF
ncbi:MAG: hypothetical protein D6791_02350 [Chloroflexi bacterium]|nr:MAG: hypothetical protein D6791_02350 [Chloroflexota bacterium]